MRTLKIIGGLLFGVLLASAQQVTPHTTLCAAVTTTSQQSICLTATTGSSPTWGIFNQTGIYVDNEYMVVNISNNQTVSGTSQYVPVFRGGRGGRGAATLHANGAVVWVAMTPAQGIPGENGFFFGTNRSEVGACTRTAVTYLPHIHVDQGVKRDCNSAGVWVNYNELGDPFDYGQIQILSGDGAIGPQGGTYVITKGSAAALTLAAPTAAVQDGTVIRVYSTTAFAHTITATGLFQVGTVKTDVGTLAAFAGSGVTLMAYNGKWLVIENTLVVFT